MVAQFNERTSVIQEYQKSVQALIGVQGYVEKHKEELSKSISPEDKPIIDSILEAHQFIVPPYLAESVNLGEVVDSADYIGEKLHTVQSILGIPPATVTIEDTTDKRSSKARWISYNPLDTGEEVEGEFKKLRENLIEGAKSSEEVLGKSPDAMKRTEGYDHISQYYDSLADMQMTSLSIASMVRELEQDEDLNKEPPQNQTQQAPSQATNPNTDQNEKKRGGLWGRALGLVNSIKNELVSLGTRIKGGAAEALKTTKDVLASIPDKIKKGFNAVLEALHDLARAFKSLIAKLVEGLFKFIPTLGRLAKEAGYGVSKIDIEIPSIEMSSTSFFGIPIPIPKISAPKMTISIAPTPAEPKKE